MADIGFSQRRAAYLYGWTFVAAAVALALRFVPYSDDHGHADRFWTAVMIALGLLALGASVYHSRVLEISTCATCGCATARQRAPRRRPTRSGNRSSRRCP
jgi:hypothetical protein